MSLDVLICRPAWVKIRGITIKPNSYYVIIGISNFNPVFGKVIEIVYIRGDIILCVQHYVTEYCITTATSMLVAHLGKVLIRLKT